MTTATTPKGYIKPNGDDPIVNGDNVISTLADQIDANLGRMASGRVTMPGNDPAIQTGAVTYPVGRFTATPHVVVSHGSSDPASRTVSVSGPTVTGFTMVAKAPAGGSYQTYWIAAQAF